MHKAHVLSNPHNLIKSFALTFLIASSANSLSLAQDLDMDCRKIRPPQCRSIESQIAGREAFFDNEINNLTEALQNAPQHQKPALRARILRLTRERANDQLLARLKRDLARCREQFDNEPRRPLAPAVFVTDFKGTVTAQTKHPRVPETRPITLLLGLEFSRNRCVVTITRFTPVTFMQATPIGDRRVTITKVGGGTGQFFPVTGQVIMPIELFLDYDTHLVDDDRASSVFTTLNAISQRGSFNVTGVRFSSTNNAPVDQCGKSVGDTTIKCSITLVGTTVFQGGFLGGHEGAFRVSGNIGVPRPTPPKKDPECLATCDELFQACLGSGDVTSATRSRCNAARTRCNNRCPEVD